MKTSTRIILAAGIVSVGVAFLSTGCCSSCGDGACAPKAASCGCSANASACACKACGCADCSCPWGNWALYLPYDFMNAGHLILAKGADGKPCAKLLWRWGSPTAEGNVTVEGTKFSVQRGFSKPKGKENDKSAWRALRVTGVVKGKTAECEVVNVDGNGKAVDKPLAFKAKRNPPVGPAPDLAKVKFGKPVNLLAGSMSDFELMGGDHSGKINGWTLKDGVLSNRITRDKDGKSVHKNGNLRTKRADFFDFNLKYEVRVLPGCNSGVYLRGIYEIQVLDSFGQKVDCHNMAAFYGRITPSVAAEKPAGEWQTVDVTLVDRHVTVVLNGKKIIDNKPVEGVTGGAMTADEFVPGPLYLQGDHSDADFRNMVLTPVVK